MKRENIFYGSQHESNRLDVYKPDDNTVGERKLFPVVVFVHGGGWCTGNFSFIVCIAYSCIELVFSSVALFKGNKSLYSLLALRLWSMGYVVVVPNFTLYPQVGIYIFFYTGLRFSKITDSIICSFRAKLKTWFQI